MASTADRRSANVFLSDLSASEIKQLGHLPLREVNKKQAISTQGHILGMNMVLQVNLFHNFPFFKKYKKRPIIKHTHKA